MGMCAAVAHMLLKGCVFKTPLISIEATRPKQRTVVFGRVLCEVSLYVVTAVSDDAAMMMFCECIRVQQSTCWTML